MGRRYPLPVVVILLTVFLALFAGRQWQYSGDWRAPERDAVEYLTIANNLARYSTHSILPGGPGFQAPLTARRPPAYPLFLAAGIRLVPGLIEIRPDLYYRVETQPRLLPLRLLQAGLLLVTAYLAMRIALLLTGSQVAGWFVLFAVGLDGSLHDMTQRFLSENLATPLFTALALCLLLLVQRGSRFVFGVTGSVLGLLALTRPVYQHFWIPIALLILALPLRKGVPSRRAWAGLLLFMTAFALPTGAWMTRNWLKLDRFFIAQGGGLVMAQRSATDHMDGAEVAASFLYWTPSSWVRTRLLPRWYGETIVRDLDARHESRFREAMDQREKSRKVHGWVRGDAVLAARARSGILRMPLWHLVVSLPLAWRGIQVGPYLLINVLLFLSLFVSSIMAVRRRDLPALVVFGPAILSFTLHALVTHNIPRYSVVLIPILWIALAYLLVWSTGRRFLATPQTAV